MSRSGRCSFTSDLRTQQNLFGLYRDVFGGTAEAVHIAIQASRAAYKRQHGGRAGESPNPFAGEVSVTGGGQILWRVSANRGHCRASTACPTISGPRRSDSRYNYGTKAASLNPSLSSAHPIVVS